NIVARDGGGGGGGGGGGVVASTSQWRWSFDAYVHVPRPDFAKTCCNEACPHTCTDRRQRCMGCRVVYYCSRACQRRAWPEHKPSCMQAQQFLAEGIYMC